MLTVTRFRLTVLAVALTLAACSESPAPGNGKPGGNFGGPGGPGGPPPTVITGTMEKRPFGVVIEAVGTALMGHASIANRPVCYQWGTKWPELFSIAL